jgi:hypothetical protein
VVQFKYLEMKVTNLNFIQEDIKKGWNSENSFCHSYQNILTSRLLCKIWRYMHADLILVVDLYGCDLWTLSSREEHRLRMFESWHNIWTCGRWSNRRLEIVPLGGFA